MKRAEDLRLNSLEQQAINILVVAFSSVSRVEEIISLTIRDVSCDGRYVSIRAKTHAATCKRHCKHLSDGGKLYPVEILSRQRADALLNGRQLLYSVDPSSDVPLTSSKVTKALKQVTQIGFIM